MSIETPRPPSAAENENTAAKMDPTTNPGGLTPASITPTGGAGARRKMGKSGPPARKGATLATRKPEKKAPTKKAARKAPATGTGKGNFRKETGLKAKTGVGGRKPTAAQKPGKTKGAAGKATGVKTAAKRAPAAKTLKLSTGGKPARAAGKRSAKRDAGKMASQRKPGRR
jgi:DNA-binding protein HU-beta